MPCGGQGLLVRVVDGILTKKTLKKHNWVVVSNMFHFHPYSLGKISNLTNIFQMG